MLLVVLTPDAELAEGATVEWSSVSGSRTSRRSTHWKRGEQDLSLDPGDYVFSAFAGAFEEYRADPVDVFVDEGTTQTVVLPLRESKGIKGYIRISESEETERVYVYAMELDLHDDPRLDDFKKNGLKTTATEDREFGFAFKGLSPGRFAVAAGRSLRRIETLETIVIEEGMSSLDLRLPRLGPGEYVALDARGPDGGPLEPDDVSVFVGYARAANRSALRRVPTIVRENGTYWVLHTDFPSGHGRDYVMKVRSKTLGEKTAKYRRTNQTEVAVQFSAPSELELAIQGEGLNDAVHIYLERHDEVLSPVSRRIHSRPRDPQSATTLMFGPLQPTRYDMVFAVRNADDRDVVIHRVLQDVRPGRSKSIVTPPSVYPLSVSVDRAEPGQTVRLSFLDTRGSNLWETTAITSDDGFAEFPAVPGGTYRAYASNTVGSAAASLRVPRSRVVVLQLQELRR